MKKDRLTKILAIVGTVLIALPILFMCITSIFSLIQSHIFRCDYLIPAEVFPVVLAGGIVLIWAALRAHSRTKLISWSFSAAVFFLVFCQLLAVVSGLAHGDREPEGFIWFVVMSSLILYDVMVTSLCVEGVLLINDLFKKPKSIINEGQFLLTD